MKPKSTFSIALLTIVSAANLVNAQGTAFTYQGRLSNGNNLANGTYDLRLTIYDLGTSGNIVGGPITNATVGVSNGLFAVTLDFGAGVFTGPERWLEIGVRTNNSPGDYFTLNPRQSVTASPYAITAGSVTGPIDGGLILGGTVTGAQLAPGAAAGNLGSSGQSGVASGGVVLSEQTDATNLLQAGYVKIGNVELAPETWQARAGSPPVTRNLPSVVWTGTEFIIWGGSGGFPFNTGGRYNPMLNRWVPTSLVNAPSARSDQSAVWTGKEMIIWGGGVGDLNTGARYNPATDTWRPTTLAGAPVGRSSHAAVWTGSEMIIFGGYRTGVPSLNSGGRYNPETDTWTATSVNCGNCLGSLPVTQNPRAVWTGTEMVVGGFSSSFQVFRYNPAADSWTASSLAPYVIGSSHQAVLVGSEIVFWHGATDSAFYNPPGDSWTAVNASGALGSSGQQVVWTGNRLVVWGGNTNNSGRYDPNGFLTPWSGMSSNGALPFHIGRVAVWTGSEMLLWGGTGTTNVVSRYSPLSNTWALSAPLVPTARQNHAVVWTGSEMLMWGGVDAVTYAVAGARYNAALDGWFPITTNNAPTPRSAMSAVWSGTEMIVWGGYGGTWLNTGGRYDPVLDSWTATTTTDAPVLREGHTAVWAGNQMIVWGGKTNTFSNQIVNTGGRYDPVNDVWTPTSTTDAPVARRGHTAVWTGTEMIIWGGTPTIGSLNTGGRYDPVNDVWTATTTNGAPTPRNNHSAVWTGTEMIIWGGAAGNPLNDGGRYNPTTDTWQPLTLVNAPFPRQRHTAVWSRQEMIIWGGYDASVTPLGSGSRYRPATDSWTTTASSPAPPRYAHSTLWSGEAMLLFGGYNGSSTVFGDAYSYTPPRTMTLYLKP